MDRPENNRPRTSLRDGAAAAACGFLLVRGVMIGAYSVGWSMTALAGGAGKWCGAALFAAGCGVTLILRKGAASRGDILTDLAICALLVLCYAAREESSMLISVADCAAVILSLIFCGAAGVRSRLWLIAVLPAVFLPLRLCEVDALRLTALCGGLAAAGMCGTALAVIRQHNEQQGELWLIVGAALAMIRP